jgi:transcriptional regulator with XRE-family HTH domain
MNQEHAFVSGAVLQQERVAVGLTQQEVADYLGVSIGVVSQRERGHRPTTPAFARRYRQALQDLAPTAARRRRLNPQPKLAATVIPQIRRRLKSGEPIARIAADLKVGYQAVWRVAKGKTWRRVLEE